MSNNQNKQEDKYTERINQLNDKLFGKVKREKKDFYALIKPGDIFKTLTVIDAVTVYNSEDFTPDTKSPRIEKGTIIMYLGEADNEEFTYPSPEQGIEGKTKTISGPKWLINDQVWITKWIPVLKLQPMNFEFDLDEPTKKEFKEYLNED